MTTAKKIGLVSWIIAEAIVLTALVLTVLQYLQGKAAVSDVLSILSSQIIVLGIVWGAQGAVNVAKNRSSKFNSIIKESEQ